MRSPKRPKPADLDTRSAGERAARPPSHPPRRHLPAHPGFSEEGLIFFLGCVLSLGWHLGILLLWRLQNPYWLDTLTFGFTNVVFGRAPAIAHGTAAGLSAPVMVGFITYIDTATVCLAYPPIVLSYKNLLERPRLQRPVQRMLARAERGLTRFGAYKMIGVFVFVWLPISMTGVVVGSALGFLMGLRSWVTLLTVMAGTCTASICWVYATGTLFTWLSRLDPRLPLFCTVVLFAALIAFRLYRHTPDK